METWGSVDLGNGRSLLDGIKSIKNYLIQNLAAIIGRIKKE